eukprot:jgi/Chlat1/2084/Chrsp17S02635
MAAVATASSVALQLRSSSSSLSSTSQPSSANGFQAAASPSPRLNNGFLTGIKLSISTKPTSWQLQATKQPARFTVEANIFDRVARIIRSFVNQSVTSVEDPEAVIQQAAADMTADLARVRSASAQVLAAQRMMEGRLKQADNTVEDWQRRAELALRNGDEELAREALRRKKAVATTATSLRAQYDAQARAASQLSSAAASLEARVADARGKSSQLAARAQAAKTTKQVNEMLAGIGSSSAVAAFQQMEEKVLALEAEAEAAFESSGMITDGLASRFAALEGASEVDDEIARMKKELHGENTYSNARRELPEARPRGATLQDRLLQLEGSL